MNIFRNRLAASLASAAVGAGAYGLKKWWAGKSYASRKNIMNRRMTQTKPLKKNIRYARKKIYSKGPMFGSYRTAVLGTEFRTTLKTEEILSFDDSGGPAGTRTWDFVLNSCFDPLAAHSAIQPNGFDNLKAMYQKYMVEGGQLKLKIYNFSGTHPIICTYSNRSAADALTQIELMNQSPSMTVIIPPFETRQITLRFNSANILGKELDEDTCAALYSADPTSQVIGELRVTSTTIADVAQDCSHRIVLELAQNVRFFKPINVVDG